jgi:hypothetical protein
MGPGAPPTASPAAGSSGCWITLAVLFALAALFALAVRLLYQ